MWSYSAIDTDADYENLYPQSTVLAHVFENPDKRVDGMLRKERNRNNQVLHVCSAPAVASEYF